MSLTLRRCRAVPVLALALAACSDSTRSDGPAGTYRLVEYEGKPVPTVIRRIVSNPTTPGTGGSTCDDILDAMTLELNADGRFSQTSDRRLTCDNGQPDQVTHETVQGSYSVSGSAVRLTFDAPAGSSLVAEGRLDSETLTIERLTATSNDARVVTITRRVFRRAR